MNNRRRKTSLNIYVPLTLLQGFEKGYSRFACERELETEQKLQYFDPYSYGRQRCVFLVLQMLNRRPWGSLCWVLLHFISNFSGPQTPSGFPRAPSARCGFPYHISSISVSNSTATRTQLPWLSYIIVQCQLDRTLDLWNRMFNRHQAEITVMQFRGHSLPMRQSMRVSWDFLARPISSANFLSQLPSECVTSFRCITLNGILGRVKGQNTTIVICWHTIIWF